MCGRGIYQGLFVHVIGLVVAVVVEFKIQSFRHIRKSHEYVVHGYGAKTREFGCETVAAHYRRYSCESIHVQPASHQKVCQKNLEVVTSGYPAAPRF